MKNLEKIIIILVCVVVGWVLGYFSKTTKVETKTYYIPETETVEVIKEVVPDGYVELNQCIPLEDINGYFYNKDNYLCFELADVGNQLDEYENWTYQNIIKANKIPHLTELEK